MTWKDFQTYSQKHEVRNEITLSPVSYETAETKLEALVTKKSEKKKK